MLNFWLPFFISATPAGALPVKGTSLRLTQPKCEVRSEREGQPGQLSFSEMNLSCEGLDLHFEVTRPITDEAFRRHLANQSVRFSEAYSAGRNPYTGFVSDTAGCPPAKNYIQGKFKTPLQSVSLHIGRLNERGVWGGCGTQNKDRWGAAASFHMQGTLIDVTVKSRERIAREQFERQVHSVLRGLESP